MMKRDTAWQELSQTKYTVGMAAAQKPLTTYHDKILQCTRALGFNSEQTKAWLFNNMHAEIRSKLAEAEDFSLSEIRAYMDRRQQLMNRLFKGSSGNFNSGTGQRVWPPGIPPLKPFQTRPNGGTWREKGKATDGTNRPLLTYDAPDHVKLKEPLWNAPTRAYAVYKTQAHDEYVADAIAGHYRGTVYSIDDYELSEEAVKGVHHLLTQDPSKEVSPQNVITY